MRRVVFGACAAAALMLAVSVAYLTRDPEPRFMARRSAIVSVHPAPPIADGESMIQSVRLTAASGLAVDLAIRRHANSTTGERLPLVILLGGHVTGADAVRLVGETPGVLVAAVAYPFDGDHRPSPLTFVRQIPMIRGALLDTPPAIMLAVDYLFTLPDADSTRVDAVGVSLGAPFVVIAGALDSRIKRIWAIHGSGGSYAPLEANMKRTIGFAPLRSIAAAVATVLAAGPQLAPERWAPRIAPRPFIMINAEGDERMPRAAVEALYESASQPKEIIWMPGGHIHPRAPVIQQLLDIVVTRVRND